MNARSARGLTPLILAADNADGALVGLLLKAGANPNIANALGTTPLMRAAAAARSRPGSSRAPRSRAGARTGRRGARPAGPVVPSPADPGWSAPVTGGSAAVP